MTQILDVRNETLKMIESNIVLQLNVTNSVLTDKKKSDRAFKEIDQTSESLRFLKNVCLDNIIDNWKLMSQKNISYARAVSGTKNIRGETVKDVQKIGKSALSKIYHKVLRNESIDQESICARLTEASSFSEDPPCPPNFCTNTFVVQSSSSSANIPECLEQHDYETLNILKNVKAVQWYPYVTDVFLAEKKTCERICQKLFKFQYFQQIYL